MPGLVGYSPRIFDIAPCPVDCRLLGLKQCSGLCFDLFEIAAQVINRPSIVLLFGLRVIDHNRLLGNGCLKQPHFASPMINRPLHPPEFHGLSLEAQAFITKQTQGSVKLLMGLEKPLLVR